MNTLDQTQQTLGADAGDDGGVMDLGGSIEAAAPGGDGYVDTSSSNNGVATDTSANGGTGGEPGGTGAAGTIDVGQLGLSNQMEFSWGDAKAASLGFAQGAATAIISSRGNPTLAGLTLAGALLTNGTPFATALGHLAHDMALLAVEGQAQASAIAGSPVSVLGLWSTTSTIDIATGNLSIDAGGVGEVQFNMYNGASMSVLVPQTEYYAYGNPPVGNGPQ